MESSTMSGINVIGYFQRTLGQGESARLMIQCLEQNQVPYSIYSVDHLAQNHHMEAIQAPINQKLVYPTNLFCIDADHVTHVIEQMDWNEIKFKYNIGLWFWETNLIPKHKQQCWDYLDEIWVTSAYNQEHLACVTNLAVHRIPHPIKLKYEPLPNSKENFNLPNCFTFLFCFDFFSSINRKNPMAIIEAFRKAFPGREKVQVIIKSHNGRLFKHQLDPILESIKDDPRIIWMDVAMDSQKRFDLMNACDCYVSLHRSEGFGLTMAEALALGKPVIATGYSGNMDFTTHDNSYICPYKLIRVGEGNKPYPAEGIWADVDVDYVAACMREVVNNPEEAKRKAMLGKSFIDNHHCTKSVGASIAHRLQEIPERLTAKAMPWRYKKVMMLRAYRELRKQLRPLKRWARRLFRLNPIKT